MKTKVKPKTKLEKKHWYHKVVIEKCINGPHYGKLMCCECGKVMRWLSKEQYNNIL